MAYSKPHHFPKSGIKDSGGSKDIIGLHYILWEGLSYQLLRVLLLYAKHRHERETFRPRRINYNLTNLELYYNATLLPIDPRPSTACFAGEVGRTRHLSLAWVLVEEHQTHPESLVCLHAWEELLLAIHRHHQYVGH